MPVLDRLRCAVLAACALSVFAAGSAMARTSRSENGTSWRNEAGAVAAAAHLCLPGNYYHGLDLQLRGSALKAILAARLFDHDVIEYSEIWLAFWELLGDRDGCPLDTLRGIYSSHCWTPPQQCGTYKKEGDCFNREHSWPKSWWGGMYVGSGAETDLFAVFPSDGYVNGIRGNYPFGTVTGRVDYNSTNGSVLGHCDNGKFSGRCFEPADAWKGVLARGFFYISTAYEGQWDCCETVGTDRTYIKPWMLEELLAWHHAFPVTETEKHYNDIVCAHFQLNRNPFIDFPELAVSVFQA